MISIVSWSLSKTTISWWYQLQLELGVKNITVYKLYYYIELCVCAGPYCTELSKKVTS